MKFTPEQLRMLIAAYVETWIATHGTIHDKRTAAIEAAARAVNVPTHLISRLEVQPC